MAAATGTGRVEKLARVLAEESVDAFFAWSPVTMDYLHGFAEGSHERFLTLAVHRDGRCALICPGLSREQASRAGIKDIRPWNDGESPLALFAGLAAEWSLKSAVLALDDEMPAHMVLAMQETLPAALFRTGSSMTGRLTRVKEPGELDLMRRAGRIADDSLAAALAILKPGVTELELEAALTEEMKRRGGKPTFCIAAAGSGGAEPHHLSEAVAVKDGDVVVLDFGCEVDGYQSDITRTVCCGKAPEEAHHVYAVVLEAHRAARMAIRAGVPAQEIDRAARSVIEKAGYGPQFMHRTGHGIGMRVHETPYIVEGNDAPLEAGNCFSVEPGIYLAGRFGVRLENIVACTQAGHESLNAEPPPTLLEL